MPKRNELSFALVSFSSNAGYELYHYLVRVFERQATILTSVNLEAVYIAGRWTVSTSSMAFEVSCNIVHW